MEKARKRFTMGKDTIGNDTIGNDVIAGIEKEIEKMEETCLEKSVGGKIKKIFGNSEFLGRISKAAVIAYETNHRSGFEVYDILYGEGVFYGDVIDYGTNERGPYSQYQESICSRLKNTGGEGLLKSGYDRIMPLSKVIIKPAKSTILPSEDDINSFIFERENYFFEDDNYSRVNCSPIYAIGSLVADNSGNKSKKNRSNQDGSKGNGIDIDMILMQQISEEPLSTNEGYNIFFSRFYDTKLSDKNRDIERHLNSQNGLRAALVRYRNENGIYKPEKSELDKLGDFKWNPVLNAPRGFYKKNLKQSLD